MGKLAFVYPGQGSQTVGMGADVLESDPEVFERYLEQADAVSGLPIRAHCLEGPIEDLTRTDVAQPALFSVSLAIAEIAYGQGLQADFVAGHSLGEYTAAVASGALSVEDGLRLVSRRGRLMADIQNERPGAMAAIIGLPVERLQELCDEASSAGTVQLANLNTPAQVVCSGEEAGIVRLLELAPEAGAEKAIRLQVGAAFHSVLMEPVQRAMAEAMEDVEWRDPDTPLVANASARVLTTGAAIHEALIAQIASPVRWVECVRTLVDQGCTNFLELGPKRVLTGLIRQIEPNVETFAADSRKKVEKFASARAGV